MGSNPVEALKFFSGLNLQLLKLRLQLCDGQIFISFVFPQFTSSLFAINLVILNVLDEIKKGLWDNFPCLTKISRPPPRFALSSLLVLDKQKIRFCCYIKDNQLCYSLLLILSLVAKQG